jgi:hypothetical protein
MSSIPLSFWREVWREAFRKAPANHHPTSIFSCRATAGSSSECDSDQKFKLLHRLTSSAVQPPSIFLQD